MSMQLEFVETGSGEDGPFGRVNVRFGDGTMRPLTRDGAIGVFSLQEIQLLRDRCRDGCEIVRVR